ncbi:MAG TPA: AAA family ATPase, partial [Prosthecobacter sp.]|nr:AAA family ATPase [Prosthecobacter sp.]
GFVTVEDYIKLPRDHSTWLIKPLLPASGAGLIYSPPKVGKSAMAVQLAHAVAGGAEEWMGFPIGKHGRVLYLQLDTPRSTWALRFEALKKFGFEFNRNLMLADRESLNFYPFDILQPPHQRYLQGIVQALNPILVIVDTLRKLHTGDENSSTVMSNVMSNLIGACHPAAVIIISHDKKPVADVEKDIMSDHRGSSSVVAEMDAIIRLTKTRLYYAGRNIEEGNIKLVRQPCDDTLVWAPDPDEHKGALESVLENQELPTMRAKARALAPIIGKSEEAAMSLIRRSMGRPKVKTDAPQAQSVAEVRRQQDAKVAGWFKDSPSTPSSPSA